MAGDWIKMRIGIGDDPDVIAIAARLDCDEDAVVGKLLRFWGWVSSHTLDGHARSVTDVWIDRYIGVTGFAGALQSVGWLEIGDDGIQIPGFERYLSEGAKTRALATNRQAKRRKQTSRKCHGASVIKPLPEKRREEKEKNTKEKAAIAIPATLDTKRFRGAWSEWLTYRRGRKLTVAKQTLDKQLAKLADMGETDAIASIEASITNGWQGLFGGKESRNGKPSVGVGGQVRQRDWTGVGLRRSSGGDGAGT